MTPPCLSPLSRGANEKDPTQVGGWGAYFVVVIIISMEARLEAHVAVEAVEDVERTIRVLSMRDPESDLAWETHLLLPFAGGMAPAGPPRAELKQHNPGTPCVVLTQGLTLSGGRVSLSSDAPIPTWLGYHYRPCAAGFPIVRHMKSQIRAMELTGLDSPDVSAVWHRLGFQTHSKYRVDQGTVGWVWSQEIPVKVCLGHRTYLGDPTTTMKTTNHWMLEVVACGPLEEASIKNNEAALLELARHFEGLVDLVDRTV